MLPSLPATTTSAPAAVAARALMPASPGAPVHITSAQRPAIASAPTASSSRGSRRDPADGLNNTATERAEAFRIFGLGDVTPTKWLFCQYNSLQDEFIECSWRVAGWSSIGPRQLQQHAWSSS
jgi:hypothetical protein